VIFNQRDRNDFRLPDLHNSIGGPCVTRAARRIGRAGGGSALAMLYTLSDGAPHRARKGFLLLLHCSPQRFNKILSDSETILFPKPLEPRRQFNMRSTLGPNPLRSTKSRARATSKSGVDKKFLILFALALGELGRHFAHSHT
jgi:hypothetical protein